MKYFENVYAHVTSLKMPSTVLSTASSTEIFTQTRE